MPEFTSDDEKQLRELIERKKRAEAEKGGQVVYCTLRNPDGKEVKVPLKHARAYLREHFGLEILDDDDVTAVRVIDKKDDDIVSRLTDGK